MRLRLASHPYGSTDRRPDGPVLFLRRIESSPWKTLAVLTTLLGSSLTACGLVDPTSCPSVGSAAIQVTVEDASTGEPLENALLVAHDGAFADSATTDSGGKIPLGFLQDRAGNYDLSVEREGFETWSRSDVEVTLNQCGHAQTVRFEVALHPT